MIKLVKNRTNTVSVNVSSTIDLTGFSAKLMLNNTPRVIDSLTNPSIKFDFTAADVTSIGNGDYLAPLEVFKPNGNVYTRGMVAMRSVDTEREAIGYDTLYLIIVGEIASKADTSLQEEIENRKAADIAVLANAKTYTNEKIKKSKIFIYAGQVNTVADLPTDAAIGDVYNVISTGANYAWNGTEWDKLSETIDLSLYVTNTTFNNKVQQLTNADAVITNALTEEVNTRTSQTNTLTQLVASNSESIVNLSSSLSTKASQESVNALQTTVNGKASQTSLDTLQTTVGSLQTEVSGKASQTSLEALETTVASKANQSSVTSLNTTISNIKSGQELLSGILLSLESDSTKKYKLTVVLANDGSGNMEPILKLVKV